MNETESNKGSKTARIREKILEIQSYLNYLSEIIPEEFEDYKKDLKTKAACEHYFEKVAEACVDLAFLVIKLKNFKIPRDDGETFVILSDNKVLSSDLAKKMRELKGMRNILAHEYGEVDDEIVYSAISEELENDVTDFIKSIKKLS